MELAPTWGLTNCYRPGIWFCDGDVALKITKKRPNSADDMSNISTPCVAGLSPEVGMQINSEMWKYSGSTSSPRSHLPCPVVPEVIVLLRAAVNHLCTLRSKWSQAAFSLSSVFIRVNAHLRLQHPVELGLGASWVSSCDLSSWSRQTVAPLAPAVWTTSSLANSS